MMILGCVLTAVILLLLSIIFLLLVIIGRLEIVDKKVDVVKDLTNILVPHREMRNN